LLIGLLLVVPGCDSCGDRGADVGGPHPYVRCSVVDEPEAREGAIGGSDPASAALRYRVEGRTLELEMPDEPLSLAAFRGPGAASAHTAPALLGLEEQGARLVLVLGGLGRTPEDVAALLRALGTLRAAVVVLPGGDDDAEAVEEGWEALSAEERAPLFDGRRLRSVRVGHQELVLVPGAPGGRYAADDGACGISAEDLESLADDLDEPAEGIRRWLVSWAAPSGGGAASVSRGFGGADAGDPRIATLAAAVRALGGLFAFPETHALEPATADGSRRLGPGELAADARVVVAPLAGPPVERADGSLVPPGAAIFTLGSGGLAYRGTAVSATDHGGGGPPARRGADSSAERALTAPGPPL
jgi:hypothetical protein